MIIKYEMSVYRLEKGFNHIFFVEYVHNSLRYYANNIIKSVFFFYRFETRRQTLIMDSGSMLAKMFDPDSQIPSGQIKEKD